MIVEASKWQYSVKSDVIEKMTGAVAIIKARSEKKVYRPEIL